jgi:cephalosporin hydroxylase
MSLDSFQDQVREVLVKYSRLHKTDKASSHAYDHFYPAFLSYLLKKNQEDIHILEVGTSLGGSLRCWMELFPKAHFYGIDWDLSFMEKDVAEDPRVQLVQCSQQDPRVATLFGDVRFDLIIDDASHQVADQVATFHMLKDRVSVDGKYVIEDVYPEHVYPEAFKNEFDDIDLRPLKNRGDDRLFVYPKASP